MKKLMILLIVAVAVGMMAGVAMAQSGTIEIRLDQSADDNEEWVCNGGYRSNGMTSSDIELAADHDNPAGCGAAQYAGLRFRNVEIPTGSRITNAYVQFSVDETDGGETNVIIYGELNANPAAFTTTANYDISGRTPTAAVVKWTNIPLWTTTHVMGPDQQTPDISSVIYEIVSLPGWASGNAIVIIVVDDPDAPSAGHRATEAVDGTAAEAALLHVEYAPDNRATLVSPIDWAYVDVGLLEWLRPDPMNPGDPGTVLVNVYFGTDPNLIVGLNGTIAVETDYDGDDSTNIPDPLDLDTVYYWRVDSTDPNFGDPITTEGTVWSFITTIPWEVIITESGGSTDVSEEDPIPNRDDYLLTLSKDPVVPVSITISEVPTYNALTVDRLELESYDGEAAVAPELQAFYGVGIPILRRVSATLDDLEQYEVSGVSNGVGSTDLEFFRDGNRQMVALRFQNVQIPQGETITSAVVEFEVDVAHAAQVYGFITGEKVVDAPEFADTAFHLRDRLAANPTTSLSFSWTASYAVNEKVLTSDISSIIQEIVDQATWASGNSLVLFFTEDRNPDAADIDFIDPTDPWASRGSSTYELNSSNWEAGVTVTIAAVDDSDLETDPDLVTLTSTTSSGDAAWTGLTVADVIVNVAENECGAWSFSVYDVNTDCFVGLADLAAVLDEYLTCTTPNVSGCVETYRP